MDLQNSIRPQLWFEISNSYNAGNYKNAILDAFRFLTKLIREKSGSDGDGAPLVNMAFGGENPKLRINKLQTKSEQDEQKGFLQLLVGMYLAIRNPRTHELVEDVEEVADAIILYINYILSVIDVAKPPFSVEEFSKRVFDPDFVPSEDYTQELIKEIPPSKRLETLIEIYHMIDIGEIKNLSLFINELVGQLNQTEIDSFLEIVSRDLDYVSEDRMLIRMLQILPNRLWPSIKKTAKMRIENKLILSIANGDVIKNTNKIRDGSLGIWATRIFDQFFLKDKLKSTINKQLMSNDPDRNVYVLRYFLEYLPSINNSDHERQICVNAIRHVLETGDTTIKNKLSNFMVDCPDEWFDEIKKKLEDFSSEENPEFYLRDGTPFLGNIKEVPEDDIPF